MITVEEIAAAMMPIPGGILAEISEEASARRCR